MGDGAELARARHEYEKALYARIEALMDATEGTAEATELTALAIEAEAHEAPAMESSEWKRRMLANCGIDLPEGADEMAVNRAIAKFTSNA